MFKKIHHIFYVRDQERSKEFYAKTFGCEPELHVPGMTEFHLNDGTIFGLMPVAGIRRLLGNVLPNPDDAGHIPRSELYIVTDFPQSYHQRAIENGARELSSLSERNWGHEVAYSQDLDGHVIAFAKVLQ